jgi:site-specific recombinase XerD
VSAHSPLVVEFASFLSEVRGNPESTIKKKSNYISHFLAFLKRRNRRVARIRLIDVDAYVLICGKHYARVTTADICSTIRIFLGFLHTTDRIPVNFSASVVAPRLRRGERPLRALPWESVQLILQGIDRSNQIGCRDYAILLMMSVYGLGAGETIRIMLEDIQWRSGKMRIVRPKTGVEILLPLLPAVAEALVDYLRHSRPVDAQTRHLFVSVSSPYSALKTSSSIRHILMQHAHAVGITGPYLGSHALRHSHACRQMEIGTPMKVVGDILGHRDPASTSAYIRISTNSLREMALAVPQ